MRRHKNEVVANNSKILNYFCPGPSALARASAAGSAHTLTVTCLFTLFSSGTDEPDLSAPPMNGWCCWQHASLRVRVGTALTK